jgi:hypothetical protein
MSDIKEPTAFYRDITIDQSKSKNIDFPYTEVYDAMYNATLPFLYARQLQPRHIATAVLTYAFDVVTTAMALAEYNEEITFDADMQAFIETLMSMINAMPDAVGANARLMLDKKSIFNIRETLDS